MGLAVSITLLSATTLFGQPLSSGSGPGTGTGMSGGAARNSTGTGLESGGPTGTGAESGSSLRLPGAGNYLGPSGRGGHLLNPPDRYGRDAAIPFGPGIGTTFPGEMNAVPLDVSLIQNGASLSTVTDRHLQYARGIPNPAERSLTLSRIALAVTFSGQLDMAETALQDASTAGLQIPQGMVRDQRLISIITALMNLAEARLREGRGEAPVDLAPPSPAPSAPPAPGAAAAPPPQPPPTAPPLPRADRNRLIRKAQTDWLRAADLAQRIGNPTYRSELIYRVADSMAFGSQTIVNEFPNPDGASDRGAAEPSKLFDGLPDRLLQQGASLSTRIDRPVWRDRALVAVATAAAESKQFARGLAVARMIPQPEVRTEALLKLADVQARRGDPRGATSTYREAAQAVASIPLDDPRTVLAGVLIDNLIAVGRFDDARSSIALYPDVSHRLVALGAIAESQGSRGAAASALAWINRDVPPQYRSQLYRRVSNGVVSAVERNRSRDLSNRSQ